MAQLTVYFKNNVVRTYSLEADKMFRIGRDETNDLVIDSSALAPAHAVIVARGNSCVIKQLNDGFPLVLNGGKTKMGKLHQGDIITAGQHDIIYSEHQAENNPEQITPPRKIKRNSYIPPVANFQVISGTNIGKIFPLKIPMTLLGEPGSGIVIVAKRKDGYFASILENTDNITINTQPLDDKTVKLNHDDVLVIGNMTVQFYLQ